MKIKFQSPDGTDYGSTRSIGIANSISTQLAYDPEGNTTDVTGEIYKNTTKIGTFTWTNGTGLSQIWYTGLGRPVYVTNGDVLKARILTPTVQETTLGIVRSIPVFSDTPQLAKFVSECRVGNTAGGTGVFPYRYMKDTITNIQQYAVASHSPQVPVNVNTIKKYFAGTLALPAQDSYVFDTTAELNQALATLVPPTTRDIFDTWARFSANSYYPDPTQIPAESEAAQWYWDDAIQSAVMPLNSTTFLGFVSPEKVDYYDHECLLKSTNGDDDWNGLLMAFVYDGTTCWSLSATACRDGRNGLGDVPAVNLNIRLNFSTVLQGNDNNNERGGGWVGKRKWVKVSRRGDLFNVYFSRWNEDTYDPSLSMTIDLNSDPRLAIFKGPQQYGYCNISQPGSTFSNIQYVGGILRDTIIDASNNQVYRYTPGVGWQMIPNLTAQAVYGAPRIITHPDTGKSFRLNVDGTITKL